jgi:hypothetical protein
MTRTDLLTGWKCHSLAHCGRKCGPSEIRRLTYHPTECGTLTVVEEIASSGSTFAVECRPNCQVVRP